MTSSHLLASLARTSVPPFLMRSRPKAIRINGRVLSITLQGDALLSQLAVVGGNKTGVFVRQVTEGSAAHTVGISCGAQIVEVRGRPVAVPGWWFGPLISSVDVLCEGVSRRVLARQVRCQQNQKALRMVLEDSTLEEAVWALGQVKGLCHLSLRPRQDGTTVYVTNYN